jgi:acyl-CoA reductase-like NAD-dependent aldehyde dehydrogenase
MIHELSALEILLFLQKELAKIITTEQGKTLVDAEGDVLRGLRK